MGVRIKIGYFLEDRGHEIFIKAIVSRLAVEKGYQLGDWIDDVRSAVGGGSIKEYKIFLKNLSKIKENFPFDILIVASDGNCKGYLNKRRQLLGYAEKSKITHLDLERFVFAIPDPHIEKWYMNDPKGFNKAVGSGVLPTLPSYKCEKGFYKKVMRDAFASSKITPQFGGYEYGKRIVEELDIYEAGKADNSFKHFCDDVGNVLHKLRGELY